MEVPPTRYVDADRGAIAYQIVGDGPTTILVNKPPSLPIDLMWEEPSFVRFLTGLGSFSRSVWFDPLGVGASDALPDIEERLEEGLVADMLSLLDEVGCERAVVLGLTAAMSSILMGSVHPERTQALVLYNPIARVRSAPDYPHGLADPVLDRFTERARLVEDDGDDFALRMLHWSPSVAGNERLWQWYRRCDRLGTPPQDRVFRLRAMFGMDIRGVLEAVHVPTLVCTRGATALPGAREYVAEHISNARLVALPGDDALFFAGDPGPFLDAIEEFATGDLHTHEISDRVLATVMFTDLVRSTEAMTRSGDRHWSELLAAHDAAIRAELDRFHGREVKSTGDGFLATFEGPGLALRCASAIRDRVHSLGVPIRIGIHTGEIELQRGGDIAGIAVVIAQRVEAAAAPNEILATRTVVDLVAGSGITFTDRGTHRLKGLPDPWHLYEIAP
jgi:class 3 adenylate cyclase